MDDPEQALAYANADFEEPHQSFIDAFRSIYDAETICGEVLDLGCGPADITIRFARAFPDTNITGIDGSAAMLNLGQERLARENLAHRIKLLQGYIPQFTPPVNEYNFVISNSLLHHLHNPDVLWHYLKAVASVNSRIFIMDLYRPDSIDCAKQMVDTYSGSEPEILKRDFFNSLCAAFTKDEVLAQLDLAGIRGLAIKTISDRHMVIYGRINKHKNGA